MSKKQRDLMMRHKKIVTETKTHFFYRIPNSHFNHYPRLVVITLLVLILYHLPILLLLLMGGFLDEFNVFNAIQIIGYYYHGSSSSLFTGILYIMDFSLMTLAHGLLKRDFNANSDKIFSIAYILRQVLISKMSLVAISLFLGLRMHNIYTFVITMFLLVVLELAAFYCHHITHRQVKPVPDFRLERQFKPYVRLDKPITEEIPTFPEKDLEPVPTEVSEPSRPTISKQSLLIKEALVPPPAYEEIQWAEMKAREFLLKVLKEQGYIELDQLPKYVGRVEIDFKKILSRMQLDGDVSILWGSDGNVVYEEDYIDKELLRYLSRNRSLTAAELAQKFNLEIETVSFKLKRWFVDGRLN